MVGKSYFDEDSFDSYNCNGASFSEKSGFNLQKVEENMWSCFYELPLEKEKLVTVLSVFLRLLFLPADTSLLPPTINQLRKSK